MSSSITRSQSLRRPAAPSSAIATRSSTTRNATASTTTTSSGSAAPRPQSRSSSPTRASSTRSYARTIPTASNSTASSKTTTTSSTTTTTTMASAMRPMTRSLSSASVSRPPPTALRQPSSTSGLKEPPPRKESSRYPPSTTLTRPPVPPRPRSSSGMASTAPPPVTKLPTQPARPRSSATNLPTNSAIRPPSLRGRQPGSSSISGGGTTSATALPASPAAAAQRRIISVGKSVTKQPPRPPSVTSTSTTTAPSSAQTPTPQPRIRPGFSTVRRHYSPVRSPVRSPVPRLSPANSLARLTPPPLPKSPANVPPPSEIGKLQAELLQLQLLHSEAASADEQWKASAKAKLGERFLRLREENDEAAGRERAGAERANVIDLGRWGAGGGLDERIQALEAIITGVWSLSDPGAQYAGIVRRFEGWIDSVMEIQEARRRAGASLSHLAAQDALFVEELDQAWRDERQDLLQQLTVWKSRLCEIDDLPDDRDHDERSLGHGGGGGGGVGKSGLKRVLEGSRSLIDDMLAELDMMGQIEREAIEKEQEWIQRINSVDDDDYDRPRGGAAWRNM